METITPEDEPSEQAHPGPDQLTQEELRGYHYVLEYIKKYWHQLIRGPQTESKYNTILHEEAQRIRRKWCNACTEVFMKSMHLWEKYNVVEVGNPPVPGDYDEGGGPGGGSVSRGRPSHYQDEDKNKTALRYGSIPGFGWTNGVFTDFAHSLMGRASSRFV